MSNALIQFDAVTSSPEFEVLRREVRDLRQTSWDSFDAEFSRKCGAQGYIGMIWPQEYGGQGGHHWNATWS